MKRLSKSGVIAAFVLVCVMFTGEARADVWQEIKDLNWEDGRYRLEFQAWNGMRSGRRERDDDFGIVGSIERDFVLREKLTVGLRFIPLFFYDADDNADDNYPETDIAGVGAGLTLRYYPGEAQDGWFFELAESIVGHEEKFNGNSGSVNFMTELGVGYEFTNDIHVSGRWRHLSNAGLADKNSGVNAFGLSIGFSF